MSCPCRDMRYATYIGLGSYGFKGVSQGFDDVHKEALIAKLDSEEWKEMGFTRGRQIQV